VTVTTSGSTVIAQATYTYDVFDRRIGFQVDFIGNKLFVTFSVAAYGSEFASCAIQKLLP
jgi:hypothetical protein